MGNRLGIAAACLVVVGAGAIFTGLNERPHQTPPPPAVTPLVACELAVMHRVPAPSDFTFADASTSPAAGGGYHLTGTVEATGAAAGRYRWTCDVEQRQSGWYPWSVTVTPAAVETVLH